MAHHPHCVELGKIYDTDINGEDLSTEFVIAGCYLITEMMFLQRHLWSFCHLSYHVFPNLQTLYTIAVSVASCERSFSKLKLILSFLCSWVRQDRFRNLVVLV